MNLLFNQTTGICLRDFSKFMFNRRPVVEMIQQIVIFSFLRKHTDLFGCGSCIVSGLSGSAAWQQLRYYDIILKPYRPALHLTDKHESAIDHLI